MSTDYRSTIVAAGFRPIAEIQPSRHRMSLPLGPEATEADIFGAISRSTRQRIRAAETGAIDVVRHDARGAGDDRQRPAPAPTSAGWDALDRFYDMLLETGERRGFGFGPRTDLVTWWRAALEAGHLVYLEARAGDRSTDPTPGDSVLAGLVLYRHGRRLSTVHSADHAPSRETHPGALHLLRWRAIQLAIGEGCSEMDLGGADVAGARREPRQGEALYGLYRHKASFGGRWLELTGAFERVYDGRGYMAGRLTSRATALMGRR